jgi:Fe-S-cluster containining protein
MSTSSSGLQRHNILAEQILNEFNQISEEFSHFQNKSKLNCIEGCGKCCFKPDIYCSPYELLPMALEFLARGEAQGIYEKCLGKEKERCVFLNVQDEVKFKAQCDAYLFRPLVCRTFGVSLRHGKNERVDVSVCKPLQETKKEIYNELIANSFSTSDLSLPFIDSCKARLVSIDPKLQETELPINQALKIILEEVLFYSEYSKEVLL